MEKYIFLDIDGVLAVPDFTGVQKRWTLNPNKQELLGRILKSTGAKIVLSSSWRLHDLEKTKLYMESHNFLFNDYMVGITIRAYHYLEKGTGIHLSIPRGVEIKQWIDTNIHSENGHNWKKKQVGKDFNYIILDDDPDMLLEHKNHFIKTNSDIGLTERDVTKAIKILNHKNKILNSVL